MEKKKKILIVTAFPTHGAGSGALITTQAKSYVEDGHEVVIITGNNRTDFEKIDGVRYHVVPFTAETESPEKIDGQCDFNYLMFTTHTESTANFWNASLEQVEEYMQVFETAIKEEIENFNPDIVHTQHNWITSSILSKFKKPVALTIHGTDLMGYQRSIDELKKVNEEIEETKQKAVQSKDIDTIRNMEELEQIYKRYSSKKQILKDIKMSMNCGKIQIKKAQLEELVRLYDEKTKYELYTKYAEKSAKNANRIIVISEDQEREFNKLFPNNLNKVKLLENGYDAQTFYMDDDVKKDEVLPQDKTDYDNLVLFVGKFADFKGIDALLNAAKIYESELKKAGKKVETLIVGSGALDEKLREQATQLELEHTYFLGRKNHQEICKLQNLADVSVIPSRNEPFGLVVIEGTACGHPVIATNAGGIPGILNTESEDISDKATTYKTKLGILVPALPDRNSNLDATQKDELDKFMAKYVMAKDEEKDKLVSQISETLNLPIKDVIDYTNSYMLTVNGISDSVKGIALKEIKFNNDEIAQYTKAQYSQDVIRDKILGIFDEAIQNYKTEQARY